MNSNLAIEIVYLRNSRTIENIKGSSNNSCIFYSCIILEKKLLTAIHITKNYIG